MEFEKTRDLISVFGNIKVIVTDSTSSENESQGLKSVLVTYLFQDQEFNSKELFYKNALLTDVSRNPDGLRKHFGDAVFWLDMDNHDWPQGSNESDLESLVIPDICGDDAKFGDFLYQLANNAQTGWIQEITKDGQRGQYYHNLVNNNHWHDLILLIQAYIKSKGEPIDEKYFGPLVFEWQGEKGDKKRVSLSKHFGARRMIDLLQENIKAAFKIIDSMNEQIKVLELLRYKPQVILQGPPGTGKTRLAHEVAKVLSKPTDFTQVTKEFVLKNLYKGLKLTTPKDNITFEIEEIKDSVKIKISTGSNYSISIENILNGLNNQSTIEEGKDGSYLPSIISYLRAYAEGSEDQVKLIQFHPSYSYEDFVRGIASKVTDGEIEYESVNRILAEFAKKAQDNYKDHYKDTTVLSKEKWAEAMILEYADQIEESLGKEPKYLIGDSIVYIFEVEEDAFRYKGDGWEQHQRGLRMKFQQLLDAYLKGADTRKDFKRLYQNGLVNQHATYFSKVLQDFKKFLGSKAPYASDAVRPALKNYVLIIDEINRANLSSVLGELIYALEYRNRAVESLYAVDGNRKILLPPNLYIIGTMNTADRSVGHIDYAIRRRFSFYPVLPDESVVREKGSPRALELFQKTKNLFCKKDEESSTFLSPEFNWEDVMIGHSYFLEKEDDKLNMRLEYEIKSILKEYIKDGILLENAWKEIEKW